MASLEDVASLVLSFNRNAESIRLLLLLSPT
jgi:hypothetical protein